MRSLNIHSNATASTLATVRIMVLVCWFIKIATSQMTSLGYLSLELFHAHGIMKLVPRSVISFATAPSPLIALQCLILTLTGLAIAGVGRKPVLALIAFLLTFYFGIAKGFGGHVNHRELLLLYVTYLLIFLPCFQVYTLFPRPSKQPLHRHDAPIFAASMQLICSLLLLNYFFVGIARICVGFPDVFAPSVMFDWVLSRNVRPNPYDWGIGLWMLGNEWGRLQLAIALPISTVVEIIAPICLWCGNRLRNALIVALMGFHIGIFFIMNIAFFENIALLAILWNDTPLLEKFENRLAARSPAETISTLPSMETR